jgi:uncharacterized protein (TIGR03067 family)
VRGAANGCEIEATFRVVPASPGKSHLLAARYPMRLCLPILLLTGVVAVADEPKKADKEKQFSAEAKKDLKKFEGKWKLIKAAGGGQEFDLKDKEAHFEFKGIDLTITFGEKVETLQITTIDTTTDPRCIDFLEKRKGRPDRTLEGVYRFDGDTLQIAHELPNSKSRPTSFEKSVDRALVWTLKRVKE